jgi:hypothetical protein
MNCPRCNSKAIVPGLDGPECVACGFELTPLSADEERARLVMRSPSEATLPTRVRGALGIRTAAFGGTVR